MFLHVNAPIEPSHSEKESDHAESQQAHRQERNIHEQALNLLRPFSTCHIRKSAKKTLTATSLVRTNDEGNFGAMPTCHELVGEGTALVRDMDEVTDVAM